MKICPTLNIQPTNTHYHLANSIFQKLKLYFPTSDLHTHIMKTWSMRTAQWKALSEFGVDHLKEGSEYFKGLKKYPFPEGKESF